MSAKIRTIKISIARFFKRLLTPFYHFRHITFFLIDIEEFVKFFLSIGSFCVFFIGLCVSIKSVHWYSILFSLWVSFFLAGITMCAVEFLWEIITDILLYPTNAVIKAYEKLERFLEKEDFKEQEKFQGEKINDFKDELEQKVFDKAIRLFGVNPLYSEEEIRRIRKKLIRKYHPDNGGDLMKCQEVNAAYYVLLKHLSKDR